MADTPAGTPTKRPRTLAEKVWDEHVVRSVPGEPDLLFIDLHLIHEVTSPPAVGGRRLAGRGGPPAPPAPPAPAPHPPPPQFHPPRAPPHPPPHRRTRDRGGVRQPPGPPAP
jgi:hypothetical protein